MRAGLTCAYQKSLLWISTVPAFSMSEVMCPRYDRMYLGACAGGQSKRLLALLQVPGLRVGDDFTRLFCRLEQSEVGGVAVGPFETSSGQYIRRVLRTSLGRRH